MYFIRMAVLLGVFALATIVVAEEPRPTSSAGTSRPLDANEVKTQIEALGSKDYREREKAGKALAAMGERARSLLRAALQTSEQPEVVRRLEALLAHVESDRLIRPTLVTLNLKNASVKTAFRELSRASGYDLKCQGTWQEKIALDVVDRPFWEVVDKLESQTGAMVQFVEDGKQRFQVAATDSRNPYVHVNGPFRITAQNINSNRNLQLAQLPRRGHVPQPEYIGMTFLLHSEPKVAILAVNQVIVSKAVDDKGVSLAQPADENVEIAQSGVGFNRSRQQSFGISLNRGDRDATLIKELKGKLSLVLLSEERAEITVLKPTASEKKKFAGHTVDMELNKASFDEQSGQADFIITFRQRQPTPNDNSWTNSIYQMVHLTDDLGRQYELNGINDQNFGEGSIRVSLSFSPRNGVNKAKPPAKLELMEWVTQKHEVNFSFSDVPLP